ncbi:MAG: S-formylglutathione hydrolase [Steroidobacteraceae bacterium]
METLSLHRCHGGTQGCYRHAAHSVAGPMRFSVFVPLQAQAGPVPVLYYLAGLTCTEETFAIKAGAQRVAAELGLMLVAPDTSPREPRLPGDADHWDFGLGAGFYLDATQAPWATHYRMYSYVSRELPELIAAHFPADPRRQGIFGHSMGGHGALTIGLRNPERFRSVSAFAPIAAPMHCPWGEKAFAGYLGTDRSAWVAYDASELLLSGAVQPHPTSIRIDQGLADAFLDKQLLPERFEAACRASGQALQLRRHAGYDHGYYFISTFIADHLRHHAAGLC